MTKVLKISVQCRCNISRKNLMLLINVKVFLLVDGIIFDGFGQACPKYPGKFAISQWRLKKEVRNERKDLTALLIQILLLQFVIHPVLSNIDPFLLLIW